MVDLPSRIRRPLAVLLFWASAVSSALAGFVTSDSSFGSSTLILDTQSGVEWLKLDPTFGLTYDQVTSQMDPGQTFAGFTVASASQVTTLFKDAGVWAPLTPLTSAADLAAGATFTSTFGGVVNGDAILTQGMSSTPFSLFDQQTLGVGYRPGVSVSSFDDAFTSRAGPGSQSMGTWLTKTVTPVPEPSNAALVLVGLTLCTVSARRRRKSSVARPVAARSVEPRR